MSITIKDLPFEVVSLISCFSPDCETFKSMLLSNTIFGKWLLPEQRKYIKDKLLIKKKEISGRWNQSCTICRVKVGTKIRHGKFKKYMIFEGILGSLIKKGKYKNGKKQGEWKIWYRCRENARMKTEYFYKNGKKDGPARKYSACEFEEGLMKKGEKVGVWSVYELKDPTLCIRTYTVGFIPRTRKQPVFFDPSNSIVDDKHRCQAMTKRKKRCEKKATVGKKCFLHSKPK
jgi:hypothetical protein